MSVRMSLLATAILLSSAVPAAPKGSAVVHDDPFNADHVDDLPADIRQYIAGICQGRATAGHDFATYAPREKRWRINLEYLQCKGIGDYRRGNQCLDVDFIEAGPHYRLAAKAYRACGY